MSPSADQLTRADELLSEHRDRLHRRVDRTFVVLIALQFVAGVVAALLYSPLAWEGRSSGLHAHVWIAVLVGGLISALPIHLGLTRPGEARTRQVIAVGQALWSALLIHLSGGRLETHFHVFGSLAFLALYRDSRVLVVSTGVVAIDHVVRGLLWPESIYGILTGAEWRWVEHSAWLVFEASVLMHACAQSGREMTEIAEGQARAERTRELVVRRVDQRTRELATAQNELRRRNAELLVARDQALEAARLKSSFLANMSHEVRTPLNGVLGMAEVLRDTGLDSEQDHMAGIIRESAEGLLSLFDDILDVARIDAGDLTLSAAPFEPAQLVEEALRRHAGAARDKGLDLRGSWDPALPRRLVGDARRLRQVLDNLLGNAVKFTDRGEVTLHLASAGQDDDGVRLTATVRDTGVGIPEAHRPRLFEPFNQVDESDSRRFGGTGLGLALSHQLLTLMGGSLGVDSTVGEGSCFRLEVPLARVDGGAGAGLAGRPGRADPTLPGDGRPRRRRAG